MNAARQIEQETHDRIQVAEANVETQAHMLQEFFRIEQVGENTVTNQLMESLHQMNSVAELAMHGQRSYVDV